MPMKTRTTMGQRTKRKFASHRITTTFSLPVLSMVGHSGKHLDSMQRLKRPWTFAVFSIHHFADLYAKKLSIRREVLWKTLWGDYYFDKKSKRVFKGAQVRR
jgi:hypothetical protein